MLTMTVQAPSQLFDSLMTQLRLEIRAAGSSAKKIAHKLGIHPQTLYKYLRAERDMPMSIFLQIAEELGVDPVTIARRAEDRTPPPKP